MTVEEYLKRSDRRGIEELFLWCVQERFDEDSWLYRVYSRNRDLLSADYMKDMIKDYTSEMIPAVVNNIINAYSIFFCEN